MTPQPGELWKHQKTRVIYKVLHLATNSTSLIPIRELRGRTFVVYCSTTDMDTVFVRPLAEWGQIVTLSIDPRMVTCSDGKPGPSVTVVRGERFVRVQAAP